MKTVEIHLFDATNIDIDNLDLLNEEDICFLSSFKSELAKKEKAISLYFKKKYIKEYYVDKNGKPLNNHTFFNISHSHGLVGIAIFDSAPIGLDIEKIRPLDESLVKYVSSDDEFSEISSEEDFFKIWTNKESLLKAIGTGINVSIKGVPSLPFEGIRTINGDIYSSKIISYNSFIISITVKNIRNFAYKIIHDKI